MMARQLARQLIATCGLGLASACNVPLGSFHSPDAAGGAPAIAVDASADGAPKPQPSIILMDDFSVALDSTQWTTSYSMGANVYVDAPHGWLILETIPNTACGSADANGNAQAAIMPGRTLIFESVLSAYADQSIYGDHQPRGLRSGTDADNALEFVSATPIPSGVTCRSVANGVVTETTVDMGRPVNTWNTYRIEVSYTTARFLVNGVLVCMHTTNIPIGVLLNPFYSTSDGCLGNVPQTIDTVVFEIE